MTRESTHHIRWTKHFRVPNIFAGWGGPHLLRDRNGNTAFCGGPGVCKFCVDGVPATGDHQRIDTEEDLTIRGSAKLPQHGLNPVEVYELRSGMVIHENWSLLMNSKSKYPNNVEMFQELQRQDIKALKKKKKKKKR